MPICRECKHKFYYDYTETPHIYESSGMCWDCWCGKHEQSKRGTKHDETSRQTGNT